MISLFESVGCHVFDVIMTDLDRNGKRYLPKKTADELRQHLPALLTESLEKHWNLILLPRPPKHLTFLQLDDLNTPTTERLAPLCFFTLCTSEDNHQAWLALTEPLPHHLARQIKDQLGADPNASGSARLAGSRNFKRARAPHFPVVTLKHTSPGRTASEDELRSYGLLNANSDTVAQTPQTDTQKPHPKNAPNHHVHPPRRTPGHWPDYQHYLTHARPARDSTPAHPRPDISAVDFAWCLTASRRGFTAQEVAAKLMTLSPKAKQHSQGQPYAERTAQRAEEVWRGRKSGIPTRTPTIG